MSSNTAAPEVTAANKTLREKADQEWLNDIMKLHPNIRDGVAKIVWWDWISGRTVADRSLLFDEFLLFSPADYTEEELIAGLLEVGYSEYQATSRVRRGL